MFIVSADRPASRVRVTIFGGVWRLRKIGLGWGILGFLALRVRTARCLRRGYLSAEDGRRDGVRRRSAPFVEDEEGTQRDEGKAEGVVPCQRLFQVEH